MKKKTAPLFCVGVDISAKTFVATILSREGEEHRRAREFTQSPEGYTAFRVWVADAHSVKRSILIVMETTGNFNYKLCFDLHEHGYDLSVADAYRISRSDRPNHPKNDRADSRRIAEYGLRNFDRLTRWQPTNPALIRISRLLATRELLMRTNTMYKNQRSAFSYDVTMQDDISEILNDLIQGLKTKITSLEKKIIALIKEHKELLAAAQLIRTVPGCEWLMAANLLVITNGKTDNLNHRTIANYLGICPHEHSSGTSVRRRAHSSRLGPPRVRKLFFLASMTVRKHRKTFRLRYEELLRRGKAKMSALNIIANKLLKIICAVLRSKKPYDETFVSMYPIAR